MKEFLSELTNRNIHISLAGDELSVKFPKQAVDALMLEEIKRRKQDIISYLNDLRKNQFVFIPALAESKSYPISSAQRRLWVLSQFEGGSAAYNMPGSAYLEQDIDTDCFARAIDSTIERHEILRTVFKEDETGEVKQWVLDKEKHGFKIDYQDYRMEVDKESKANLYISEDSYKPFDLEKGPLLRASLIRLEEQIYLFYYNMHHIVSDGWSMEVLTRDVFAYYEAYKTNQVPPLKKLRIQYKDYSAWQLSRQDEESVKAQRSYWLKNLGGELPLLDLPTGKQRPRIKTNNGYSLGTYINSSITAKLNAYSKKHGGSLFMGLLAAWNVLIYRYTSQTDVITGTPVAGRQHADLDDQIGFYVNTLALRNQVDPGESFNNLFSRIKQNTLNAYEHQMYPFDRLVEELDLTRNTSRSPVFDVILALQNNGEKTTGYLLTEEELSKVTGQGYGAAKFDMDIAFQETENYLSLQVIYNSDVYEKPMVEGLLKHYRQLLNALLENPDEKIGQVDYLSQEEKQELLFAFNNTEAAYPKDKTITELFEEQVTKTPDHIAVVFEDRKLSYKQLDELSNRLAHYLQTSYRINADDLVGIKLDRSEWMIISILAVLKSGGAYVPIDPTYPKDRVDYILSDSKCKTLLDEEGLTQFKNASTQYAFSKLKTTNKPTNLAYVIYTSGTTGNPKGVMVEHATLVNLCFWHKRTFSITEQDRASLYAGVAFDASVWELFPYLISGASVYVVPVDIRLDTKELNTYYEAHQITISFLPTQIAEQFQETENKSLRYLLAGGEKINRFKKQNYRLVNNYGPTESTVVATSCEVNTYYLNIPIGKPISNTQIYILNADSKLQPVGVAGEICIGGDGLARGYLNQSALTKEKFIEHPFKEKARLYKTGDLGRWLPGGSIEFSGRKDGQVKIRGYRIELGEIEQALLKKDSIREALVIAKENQNKEKELIAYVVSGSDQNATELRTYLKAMLPEYMLPTYYVQLGSLPLNSNGKVDRKQLQDPEGMGLASGIEHIAPENELEEKLVKIWQEVLQRNRISVTDDFFALGGYSIRIIQANKEYQQAFNEKVSLDFFISNPTIRKHASYIADALKKPMKRQKGLSELNSFSKTNKNMIMVPPIQGESVYFLEFAKFIQDRFNCYGINYGSDYHFKSLLELSGYYAEIINTYSFNHEEPLCIMGFSMGVPIAFEIAKLLESQNYHCELFLIDRFPNNKSVLKEIQRNDSRGIGTWLEQQVSIASKISPGESSGLIKERIINNYNMLNSYETETRSGSNISCLQGLTGGQPFDMKLWEEYTYGKFRSEKIEASHNEIFKRENYEKLYNFIQKT